RKTQIEDNKSKAYHVNIYRAQGGRIRIEKHDQEQKITTILNGLAGIEKTEVLIEKPPILIKTISLELQQIMDIKRAVRLYPRNFLAHVNEHSYDFKGLQLIDNVYVYVLDLLVEDVTYYFDPTTFFCLSLIDKRNNSKTYYSDYQKTDNIFTPLKEKTILDDQTQIDYITHIKYNLKLANDLFVTSY
ncbi:MAG: hypothetical protein FD167_1664, partial [bacterium]